MPARPSSSHSLTTTLEWLASCKLSDLVMRDCIEHMHRLCALADNIDSQAETYLGLEVHHNNQKTDLSLFGGHELLQIPEINYPLFALRWKDFYFLYANYMAQKIVVEFDYVDNSFKLMGFFQRYLGKPGCINCILESIRFYASIRNIELEGKEVQNTRSTDESIGILHDTFKAIGPPHYVGYLERRLNAVKLITEVSDINVETVLKFCGQYFSNLIVRQLKSIDALGIILYDLVNSYQKVNLSLDFDIATASFLDRLSLECMPYNRKMTGNLFANHRSRFEDLNLRLGRILPTLKESLALEKRLPYAAKRPSNTLVNTDILLIDYSHRKIILENVSSEIKDYVYVRGFRQSQSIWI